MTIKEVLENPELKNALEDFFSNEPTEELAIAFGIQQSWEHCPGMDNEYRRVLCGEVEFPLSNGERWKAEAIGGSAYGIYDSIKFTKLS